MKKKLLELNKQERFDYLQSIIDDIEAGKRQHNQKYYCSLFFTGDYDDCGTAFCIAGWLIHDIANQYKSNIVEETIEIHKPSFIDIVKKQNLIPASWLFETMPIGLNSIKPFVETMAEIHDIDTYAGYKKLISNTSVYTSWIWAFGCAYLNISLNEGELLFNVLLDLISIKQGLKFLRTQSIVTCGQVHINE